MPVAEPETASLSAQEVVQTCTGMMVESLLTPWPGGSLLAPTLAPPLAAALVDIHEMTNRLSRHPLPLATWLASITGLPTTGLNAADLGNQAGARLLASLQPLAAALTAPSLTSAASPALGAGLGGTASPTAVLATMASLGLYPPARWTLDAVNKALFGLESIGLQELRSLPARLATATAVAGVAVVTPGIRSTTDIGTRVHPELQIRYLEYFPGQLVVADRRVWSTYPVMAGTPLSQAAKVPGAPPSLAVLSVAWLTSTWTSSLRSDLTNLTQGSNFEVKPVLAAPMGVLQEAWYRCSYNFARKSMLRQVPAWTGRVPLLSPGAPMPQHLLRPIPLPATQGQPAAAVPFMMLDLPGMVLYFVVSGPTMVDLVELAAALSRRITAAVDEAARRLGERVTALLRPLREAVEVVMGVLLAVAIGTIVIAALVAAGLIVAGSSPAWLPAVVLSVGSAGGLVLVLSLRRRGTGPEQGEAAADSMIDMVLPGLTVRLPADQVARLSAVASPLIAAGLAALARAVDPPRAVS